MIFYQYSDSRYKSPCCVIIQCFSIVRMCHQCYSYSDGIAIYFDNYRIMFKYVGVQYACAIYELLN